MLEQQFLAGSLKVAAALLVQLAISYFALLILLVVLPSAGLSGFGVVAIINERAAVEKRLSELLAPEPE